MFGIGGFELFLILLFGFLVFGPDKLPALAKTVGQAIAKFRDAQAEMTEQLKLDELLKGADAKGARKAPAAKATGAGAAGGGASVAKAGAEGAQGAAAAASPAGAAGAPGASSAEGERLSFSERKARYEAERAAQAAAEQDAEGGDA
ncbi:MAG: twin-arginine translocase TatA/TatE family subunit [Eggerthellaceae bacterium]|nr:twin-arginine translocase TatA/TatE family subunit [Eggerthellaceae bacterium]